MAMLLPSFSWESGRVLGFAAERDHVAHAGGRAQHPSDASCQVDLESQNPI